MLKRSIERGWVNMCSRLRPQPGRMGSAPQRAVNLRPVYQDFSAEGGDGGTVNEAACGTGTLKGEGLLGVPEQDSQPAISFWEGGLGLFICWDFSFKGADEEVGLERLGRAGRDGEQEVEGNRAGVSNFGGVVH